MRRYVQAMFMAALFAVGCLVGRFVAIPSKSQATATIGSLRRGDPIAQVATVDMRPRPPDWITMCLTDPDHTARSFAFQQWLAERAEDTYKLKRLVDNTETPSATRYYAVKLLGRLGTSGEKVLVKHIAWRHDEVREDKTTPFGEYPCAEALVVMGLNCVPEVIDSLARGERGIVDELTVSLRASVLIEIYSRAYGDADGPKEAIALIERDLERSSHYTSEMYYHRRNVERLLNELRDRSEHPHQDSPE